MEYIQSKKIEDYSILLNELYGDFGNHFCHTALCWCGLMEKGMQPNKYYENKYWEIWIIKDCGATIGICGLYSLRAENVETLWLGWLGITPEFRNTGFGSIVLSWLKEKAKGIGAKTLMSYVDKNGKPLPFYKRNGFTIEGRVDDFVVTNGLNISDFEGYDDFVIKFPLG